MHLFWACVHSLLFPVHCIQSFQLKWIWARLGSNSRYMGTDLGINIPAPSFVLLEEICISRGQASVCGPSYGKGLLGWGWIHGKPLPTFGKMGLVWIGMDDVPQGDSSANGHPVWVSEWSSLPGLPASPWCTCWAPAAPQPWSPLLCPWCYTIICRGGRGRGSLWMGLHVA